MFLYIELTYTFRVLRQQEEILVNLLDMNSFIQDELAVEKVIYHRQQNKW